MRPAQSRLRRFIADETPGLLAALKHYLLRAGGAHAPSSLEDAAHELLNEVVVEALRHETRFQTTRQPRAWLLGIAANLIRRKQVELAKRERREPLAYDLYRERGAPLDDDAVFDWLTNLCDTDQDDLESDVTVSVWLAKLAPEDRQIIQLAVLHQLDGQALGAALGISPGAARVRLHRALQRARLALADVRAVNDD